MDHHPFRAELGTVEVRLGRKGETRRVPWEGEIICGHNPFLVARLARVWPTRDGSDGIEWEDDPRPTGLSR